MAEQKYICSGSKLTAVADAIRTKTETQEKIALGDMPALINAISANGISIKDTGGNKYPVEGMYYYDEGCTELITPETLYELLPKATIYRNTIDFDLSSVSWSNSSWDEISTALDYVYNGIVSPSTLFKVGDVRSVNISSIPEMTNSGVTFNAQSAQTLDFVICDITGRPLREKIGTRDRSALVVGSKDCMNGYFNAGDINASNVNWTLDYKEPDSWYVVNPLRVYLYDRVMPALESGLQNLMKDTIGWSQVRGIGNPGKNIDKIFRGFGSLCGRDLA